ncbi:MAG: hypothetical protein DI636_08240 [Pelagerythrobacter marensis]|uniref:hypothetical protein n=1 Tax=Qipengyuania sp. YIM B01966 TaxID=2778646 RepID=UPI000DB0B3B4|nr:hypothetical protein [Qipengyuania sp. YIM B01966]PZO68822.1 MAG: hypothetical protein DI636_08240 [Pelagerythrobacter marensis]PZU16552.1 MAG: hypothetical protein DI591_06380 [Citromicrobium sp.]
MRLSIGMLLGVWLAISGAVLSIGFFMLGFPYLPPINTFTVAVVYLPWVIIAGLLALSLIQRAKAYD